MKIDELNINKTLLAMIIALAILAGGPLVAMASQPKAGFETDYESWVNNAHMHMEKGQHANAVSNRARRSTR